MSAFFVSGTPAPKGSARAIQRGGFAVLVPSTSDTNKRAIKSWTQAVGWQAKASCSVLTAVRRSLGIPAGPKDRTKRERNAALVEIARTTKATYAEIGWRFGLDKTRANQIALAHGIRRSA